VAPTPRAGRGNSLTLLSAAFDILRCAVEDSEPGIGDAAVASAAARSGFVMGQCLLATLTQARDDHAVSVDWMLSEFVI